MKLLQEIKAPQESVNDLSLEVIELSFSDGDFVSKGDVLIELESSKTSFSIIAETDGYIKYLCTESEEVSINSVIIRIFETWEDQIESNIGIDDNNLLTGKVIFSKKAIALVEKHNLSKESFRNLDFVSVSDVLAKLNIQDKVIQNEELRSENIPTEDVSFKKLSKHKRTEIAYLKDVQSSNLTSTVNIYVDTKYCFEFLNPNLKYFKNSLLPIIVYETSKLLIKYPVFNAFYANDSVGYYNSVNCGIAIDMEHGLKTVKLPNTNTLQIAEIENLIFELSNKYIDNKLSPADLNEITFTITDLSTEGTAFFLPLINRHNSAILAISANDKELNRTLLSLTFDHRLTEGRLASIFLRELKDRLQTYKFPEGENIKLSDIVCFKCMKSISEDYNGVGFLRTVLANGKEANICQSCFNGF